MPTLVQKRIELNRIRKDLTAWSINMHGSHKRRKRQMPKLAKLQDRYLKLKQVLTWEDFFKRVVGTMGIGNFFLVDNDLETNRTDVVRPS